jgi:hypothetical protein
MSKKGQAAMEFLMTYGWAILVVLAAIGALAYFGVLSPDKFLPEKCLGSAGLDCTEKASITSGTAGNGRISFALKNNLGHNINLTGIADGSTETSSCDAITSATASVNGATAQTFEGAGSAAVTVNNGQAIAIIITCTNALAEGRATADFSLEYKSLDSFLDQKTAVSIRGKGTA